MVLTLLALVVVNLIMTFGYLALVPGRRSSERSPPMRRPPQPGSAGATEQALDPLASSRTGSLATIFEVSLQGR